MNTEIYVVFILYIIIFVIYRYHVKRKKLQRKELYEVQEAEARRLSECKEVVRYFANYHGYIARSVVSKNELEEMIENGVTALELEDFIAERILNTDGLNLGYQSVGYSKIPVILPEQFRDKHIYIIGKSGYGKTNFLRHLIYQDLQNGNGLGVLAPEFEMLNDEILPFIPKERIQDVIYFKWAADALVCPSPFIISTNSNYFSNLVYIYNENFKRKIYEQKNIYNYYICNHHRTCSNKFNFAKRTHLSFWQTSTSALDFCTVLACLNLLFRNS